MGSHVSTFQQKVNWMVAHQDRWKGWPTRNRFSDNQLKRQMVADGLISDGSHSYDIMDFGKLVSAAREQIKKQGKI